MDAQGRPQNASQASSSSAGGQQEGYWGYMQRQITERTEKLGNLSESVDQLGESSASWANDASKFVQKQKKNLVMGVVKSKFGL
jgi:syntaxin-binding protein 5